MFQTFISRHNSNFFSDKLVLTSVTPASSAPVLQTPKRSEERFSRNAETDLVCRLLLEKKKKIHLKQFSNEFGELSPWRSKMQSLSELVLQRCLFIDTLDW